MSKERKNLVAENTNTQNLQQSPAPDPELRRLDPLIGTWMVKDRTQDSILGPGVPVTNTEEFFWLEGGYILVQTYDTVFGDDPAQRGVNYWYYDNDTKKFRIIFLATTGRLQRLEIDMMARSLMAK